MNKPLYPWQEKCLEQWFSHHCRGMVQAATGAGKTYLSLTGASRLQNRLEQPLRVKIVVPSSALMRQWKQALVDFYEAKGKGEDIQAQIGIRGGGCLACESRTYMIYVINSARYELARQILEELKMGYAVLLIADECHRYESSQNRLIFEFLPLIGEYEKSFFSLGLSATLPSGQGLSYLTSVLGPRLYSYGIRQAAAGENICPYEIYHITLSFQPEELEQYLDLTEQMRRLYLNLTRKFPSLNELSQKERFEFLRALAGNKNRKTAQEASRYIKLSYTRKGLVCLAGQRLLCAYDLILRLPAKERILIFGERVSQADQLYFMLSRAFPGQAGRYHSHMSHQANRNTLERFRNGELRILIACRSIDEGVDIPDASTGIILSGTSIKRQRIQRLGRIIRKKEGKQKASLYYLHIDSSSEDSCFLPDSGENRITELDYRADTHTFSNPLYEKAARRLLEHPGLKDRDGRLLAETLRCLELGSVRFDWTEPVETLTRRIQTAASQKDKNYWICMRKIARLRQQQNGAEPR